MKAWLALCLIVLAGVAGVNVADLTRRVPPPPRVPGGGQGNALLAQEARLAPVRRALEVRAVRGAVGYVSDLPPDELRQDAAGMERYFHAQFALAPWILDPSAERCAWAVLDLQRAAPAARRPAGYVVVEDFGTGLQLLRRAAP